ncbi:Ankyrin repeat protein [Giardia duodenalis]|uniref:Ankyrin repeat protein n=1 Tax=Giardia intestinalis TaxID=5741 RepID=V6TJ21_GIAIN|nr:Ankyrin repeat protein [Giardia intestinalis]
MSSDAPDDWIQAISARNVPAVKKLMEGCARRTDSTGTTGLMLAAKRGSLEIVELLAPKESGMLNSEGHTAMMLAAMQDHLPICAYLGPLEKNVIGANDQDVFMIAVSYEAKDVVEYLSGAYPLRKDADGHSVFDFAIAIGNAEILHILLSSNSLDDDERNRLSALAQESEKFDLVDLLREVRCDKKAELNSPGPPTLQDSPPVLSIESEPIPISSSKPDFRGNYLPSGSRKESTDGYDRYSTTVAPEVSLNVMSASSSPKTEFRPRTSNHWERLLQDRDDEIQRLQSLLLHTADVRAASLTYESLYAESQVLSHIFRSLKKYQLDIASRESKLLYFSLCEFTKVYAPLISPCDTRVFDDLRSVSPNMDVSPSAEEIKTYRAENLKLLEKLDEKTHNIRRLEALLDNIKGIIAFHYHGREDAYQPDNIIASLQLLLQEKTDRTEAQHSVLAQRATGPTSTSSTATSGPGQHMKLEESTISTISEIPVGPFSSDTAKLHQLMDQKNKQIDTLTQRIHELETTLADTQNKFKNHVNFTKTVERNLADTVSNQINLFVSGQHRTQKLLEEKDQEISQLYAELDEVRSAQTSRTASPLRSRSAQQDINFSADGYAPYGQPVQIPTAILPPKTLYPMEQESDEYLADVVPRADYDALLAEYTLAQERFQKHMDFVGAVENNLAQSLSDQVQAFAAESRNIAGRMIEKDEEIARLVREISLLRASLSEAQENAAKSHAGMSVANDYDALSANIEASRIIQQLRGELQELNNRIQQKDEAIVSLQNTLRHQRFPRHSSPTKQPAALSSDTDLNRLQQEFDSYRDHAEQVQKNDQSLIQVLQARIKQQNDILEATKQSSPSQARGKQKQRGDDGWEDHPYDYAGNCPNCAELASQNQRNTDRVKQLNNENKLLSDELDKSKGALVLLRNEREDLLQQLSEVLKDAEEHHKKDKLIEDLNNECTSLTGRVDQLLADLNDQGELRHELGVLKKANDDQKALIDEVQSENIRLVSLLEKRSAVCDGETMTDLTYHAILDAFSDIETLRRHITDLKGKIHKLETDADKVEVRLEQSSPFSGRVNDQQLRHDSPSIISPYVGDRGASSAKLDHLQRQMNQLQDAVMLLTREQAQQPQSQTGPGRSSSTIKNQTNLVGGPSSSPRFSKPSTIIDGTQSPQRKATEHTPLMQAVLVNNIDAAHRALQYAKAQLKDGTTALMLAVNKGNQDMIRLLAPLEGGLRRKDGKLALHLALKREDFKVAQLLTKLEGADVSSFSTAGGRRTELMDAIIADDYLLGWSLFQVQSGLQDKDGKTALMYAAYKGNTCFVNMLKKRESRLRSNNGMTALMYAARSNKPEVVRLLMPLEGGLQDKTGISIGNQCSALMHACYNGSLDAVMCLVSLEAELRDSNNRTAMYYATHCSSIVTPEKKEAVVRTISTIIPSA